MNKILCLIGAGRAKCVQESRVKVHGVFAVSVCAIERKRGTEREREI